MEEKIKKLKGLKILRDCAMEYDSVPEIEEAQNLVENILYNVDLSVESLQELMIEYIGWSPSEIEDSIMRIIDEL